MFLRKRLHNSQAMINAGMICCATGLVAQRFIHPPTDFWQGFVAGLSGVLIGLSIVFNMRGLMLRRKLNP
ncbi:MAG: hypothetical protein IFK93_13725 [Acidobacteria bacterium]|nr:hypothetical protein [Candidatus Sulfomarinibacter kjeldsenii]